MVGGQTFNEDTFRYKKSREGRTCGRSLVNRGRCVLRPEWTFHLGPSRSNGPHEYVIGKGIATSVPGRTAPVLAGDAVIACVCAAGSTAAWTRDDV
jgi:hypothetical protein